MGVGHLAAALMLKRADSRINLGLLFFAVLLSDFLLGIFFFAGLETASVPSDFEHVHSLNFTFPYSHGLAASLVWSVVVFALSLIVWQKGGVKAALVLFPGRFFTFCSGCTRSCSGSSPSRLRLGKGRTTILSMMKTTIAKAFARAEQP